MEKTRKTRRPIAAKEKALRYFVLGLSAREIELLTNIPKRTVEGYMMRENWNDQRAERLEKERKRIVKESVKAQTA